MKVDTVFRISFLCILLLFVSVAHAEQEYTAFDLYLGDEFKGLVPVYYSETSSRFEIPSDVLKVAGLNSEDLELLELVNGEFPLSKEKKGVGTIVVDPKTFRVVLIPDQKFLSLRTRNNLSLLNSTADKMSFRNDMQFLLFETAENEQIGQYRLFNNLSLGQAWLNSDLEFIDDQQYSNRINDLTLNAISGRWQSTAGYLQSTGRQLTPSASLLGVTFRTEPLLFSASDELRGSILQLYVPTRSKVEFFRNGVLIDTQVLQSGYQEVDTARFPQGSYYVDMIIRGLAGTSRERRFFAKSGFLTTNGAPQFRFDLGELRDSENNLLNIPYYQASGEFRLANFMQLNLSSFGTDDKQSFVSGFNAVYGNFLATGAVGRSTNGKTGLAFGGGGSLLGLNFSGDYEKSEQVSIDELERIDFDQNLDSVEKPFLEERLGSEGKRYTATVSKWINDFEIRYNYSYILAEPDPTIEQPAQFKSYGPTLRYRILEDAKDSVYMELSSLKTNNIDNHYALLTWQHRFAPWSTDTSVGLRKRDGKPQPVGRGIVQYDTIEPRSGRGVRARAETQYQELDDQSQESGSFDIRAGSNYGGLTALGNGSKAGETNSSSWAVGGNVSLAKGSGSWATGPTGLGQSLLVVELENVDNQALTDIIIDGQTINKIKGSGRYVLGISPYQKVKVRIRPSEESPLTRYDTKTRDVVLYPGSVQTENFKIEKVFLAIGYIVDGNGNPLELKRISGLKDYPLTEQAGYFQAEVAGTEVIKIEITKDNFCTVKFPKVKNKQYYHDFGKLVCR